MQWTCLDLNVPELLSVTVLGREFQVAGAELRKARLAKATGERFGQSSGRGRA